MKMICIIAMFAIYTCFLYSQEASTNAGAGGNSTMDYIIGESFYDITDINGSFTPFQLAIMTDSSGIYRYDDVTMQISPNPASNSLMFSIDRADYYKLILINLNGEIITTLLDDYLAENQQTVLDISKLKIANGTYYIQILSNNIRAFASIVIAK